MKKQDRNAALEELRIADLEQRAGNLATDLETERQRAGRSAQLAELSTLLIGELDPGRVVQTAQGWISGVLERPSTITLGTTMPLVDLQTAQFRLTNDDTVVGWLSIGGDELDADTRTLVEELTQPIGRALGAAIAVAGRSDGFRTLERSLLPDALLPLSGLQLASRYLPATGAHDVGGDFYDAVRVGERMTLIVGDVQGKGVEAATLTSLARHTLRAGSLAGRPPAGLLEQLNTALLYGQAEQLHAGHDPVLRFVTAVVASIEPTDTGFSVRVARAGQPPPIIVRSEGTFEHVEPKGVLLGVCQDPVFEEVSVDLVMGDTLILYTDGVIEQRDASRSFSEQHLAMLVRNRRNVVDAEATAQLIEDTVHLVAPEKVRDDVAILVACAVPDR